MKNFAKVGLVLGTLAAIVSPVVVGATTLFTAPAATTTFTNLATWSTEGFDSFLPITYIIVGLVFGALLVGVIIRSLLRAGKMVFRGGRGGRRGRRR